MDPVLIVLVGIAGLLLVGTVVLSIVRRTTRKVVRTAVRVRDEGLRSTVLAPIDAIAAWAEVERPSLRLAAAPDGTVTLLFTDIEGSTAANERLGDSRWMEVLRAHNSIIRNELKARGGHEVKSHGDGFMLAFSSADVALECAIGIQRALADGGDAGLPEPVRVRIGVHTGEAVREARDFYGINVTLAARIADHARAGEILASPVVKELVSDGDFVFEEAGALELKGVSERQRVYRVAWRR